MLNNRFLTAARRISSHTVSLLNTILPILLMEFIWFAASFILTARLDPIKAADLYYPMIEYLMTSLLLTIGGGVVFDIAMTGK